MKTITKDILKAAKFAATNTLRPALATVKIDDNFIIATDGYKIIRIKHNGHDLANFPVIAGTELVKELSEPILLDAGQLLKKLKFEKNKTLPMLETVALCNNTPDCVSIASTDLKTQTVLQFKKVKENYPQNIDSVFPQGEAITTSRLDVDLLIDTLQAFKTEGTSYVRISLFGVANAVRFTGENEQNSHIEALLMPKKPPFKRD